MSHPSPALVLLDIEGTTAPIRFVHQVLFPYARAALPRLIAERGEDPAVRDALAQIATIAPGQNPLDVLTGWMDRDEKIGPLKALQGIAWDHGYRSGELVGALYPDVLPALEGWARAGVRLAVYSSGSEAAQRLIYGHTTQGDVTALFEAFFDLRVGGKKDAASYAAIAAELGLEPARILFLSDVAAELDAARDAGLLVAQIARPEDETAPCATHPAFATLNAAGTHFALPEPA